ncbi:integrase [Streptomyces zinciresistens K42]|uniref:Integrase n=1 Tax=Streptomyces zinciresistens K42 TaxID=700597 RepID=G2G8T9_9ACTN|nr:site-specific integrase [Streptomyces zinciresistens]EGX60154.1 integrase [Streptomyces zinciresistens K42]
MASIVPRPKKSGEITYQVKWRQDGDWQTENFGGEEGEEQAGQFRKLVEAHGNRWPHGWIKGRGFVEPDTHPDDVDLIAWAHRYADRLTGISERTRADYKRDISRHFAGVPYQREDGSEVLLGGLVHTPLGGGPVLRPTVCNVTADDVGDWVLAQENGVPHPSKEGQWLRQEASGKSIANRHGLLYSVFQAAVETATPLRPDNPCSKTRLPRSDDGIEEEMTFLEHDEYARISSCMRAIDPAAADLADFLVGTGLRWGEASALQARDVNLKRQSVNVQRAWKRKGDSATFELGPPKTKRSRRTLALSDSQMEMLRRHLAGRQPEDFIFRGGLGKAWRHSNFFHRKWQPAVAEAIRRGLTKRPRLHDLRHTHVAWLIEKNIPLPAIQARLGHESITTTVDRYGHLVSALDGEIAAAVEAAMGAPAPRGLRTVG